MCWSVKVGDAPLSVGRFDLQLPAVGVHHWQVYVTADETPDGAFECDKVTPTWTNLSTGARGTQGANFPPGTAMTLPAGSRVILQLHVLNVTGKPLELTPGHVDLVPAAKTAGMQDVGIFVADQSRISIPARTSSVSVKQDCRLKDPLEHVFLVWPHMHQLGKNVSVSLEHADGTETKLVDTSWDYSSQKTYGVDESARAGDVLDVRCNYANDTDHDVSFGPTADDEMCTALVYYWPATQLAIVCSEDDADHKGDGGNGGSGDSGRGNNGSNRETSDPH